MLNLQLNFYKNKQANILFEENMKYYILLFKKKIKRIILFQIKNFWESNFIFFI
jgi:hypothetical protein